MSITDSIEQLDSQLLPADAYTSDAWLAREHRNIFSRAWSFACAETDLQNAGDYVTAKVGKYDIVVLRDDKGALRAFHNICRHRGAELVDRGCGNTGKMIVCPYHRWTYGLDGALRGLPNKAEMFPDFDRTANGLHKASAGSFGGLVFVCPEPDQDIADWLGDVTKVPWPHDLSSSELVGYGQPLTYEMKCNWKLFFENAIDGYHLAYLHEHTLGGPKPSENIWDLYGDHQVWYSTENEEYRSRVPNFVTKNYDKMRAPRIKHVEGKEYGGVYMMFPTTIVVPTPWALSVSVLEPVDANTTLLHAWVWTTPKSMKYRGKLKDIPGYDAESGMVKSSHWKKHPLETGDFQTEDVYVVEKVQRAMHSPKFEVGSLSQGPGGESPLVWFQRSILSWLGQ